MGRRIQRTPSNGVTTNYIYDGQDVVLDQNSDGSTVRYLNGPGIDNKLRQTSNAGALYFMQDHLGSTRALTNANGTIVEQLTYDSFGNGAASAFTRYTYTGRERDPDTAQLYYRARYYDPRMGRFISEDPIGLEGGINLYAYVKNGPLQFTDPAGTTRVGFGFTPESYPTGRPVPLYPDTYDWNGAFWKDFGTRCKGILQEWKATYYDQLADPIKFLLSQPDVQFALMSMGMPYGTPFGGYGAAAVVPTGTGGAASGAAGDHIVLGLERFGLDQTASQVGGRTLMNDVNWRTTLQNGLGNPNTRFTVSLDGVRGSSTYSQFMGSAQRGLAPGASPFNWEMGQLYQAGRHLDGTFVIDNGRTMLQNPFGP